MHVGPMRCAFFFLFNDTATTEIYTLSLPDALPICKLGLNSIGNTHDHDNEMYNRVVEALDLEVAMLD